MGLACGGAIDVLVEPFAPARGAAASSAGPGGAAVVIPLPGRRAGPRSPPPRTRVRGRRRPRPCSLPQDGSLAGTTGSSDADASSSARAARELLGRGRSGTVEVAGRQYFIECVRRGPASRRCRCGPDRDPPRPLRPRAGLCDGRGRRTGVLRHAGAIPRRRRARGRLAGRGGRRDRPRAGGRGRDPHPRREVRRARDRRGALRRGCRYVGAIGSRRTQAERRARLLAAGVAEADLARLRGPIGLDLGGRTPAETALAIMAEIVAERRGGSGVPMQSLARG